MLIARFSLLRTHILLTANDLYRPSLFVNNLVDIFWGNIILSTVLLTKFNESPGDV